MTRGRDGEFGIRDPGNKAKITICPRWRIHLKKSFLLDERMESKSKSATARFGIDSECMCVWFAKMQSVFPATRQRGGDLQDHGSERMIGEADADWWGTRKKHTDRVYNSNPMKYKRKDSKAENHKRMSSV